MIAFDKSSDESYGFNYRQPNTNGADRWNGFFAAWQILEQGILRYILPRWQLAWSFRIAQSSSNPGLIIASSRTTFTLCKSILVYCRAARRYHDEFFDWYSTCKWWYYTVHILYYDNWKGKFWYKRTMIMNESLGVVCIEKKEVWVATHVCFEESQMTTPSRHLSSW